jgi:hypothetical protein
MGCPCDDADVCPLHPWPLDYWRRVYQIKRDGLGVRLKLNIDHDGFISFHVAILSGQKLRDETAWPLHITLGYIGEIDWKTIKALRLAWHNKVVHLPVNWIGKGGTAMIAECALTNCPSVRRAHDLGHYWYVDQLHISF